MAAQRLAVSRNHPWLILVNDSIPECPNTTRSHSSLVASVSGVDKARWAWVIRELTIAW